MNMLDCTRAKTVHNGDTNKARKSNNTVGIIVMSIMTLLYFVLVILTEQNS